jgi:hypothetical protein
MKTSVVSAVGALMVLAVIAAACDNDGATTTTAAPASTGAPDTVATTSSSAPTSSMPIPVCSAAGMAGLGVQEGLPDPVAATRSAIADAAVVCDFEGLVELARDGPGEFIFAGGEILVFVGPADDATALLRGLEEDGVPVTADAVAMLGVPYGFIADPEPWGLLDDPALAPIYVWPAAAIHDSWSQVPEVDREAIRPLLGDAALQFFGDLGFYTGPRLGITETGDWVFHYFGDQHLGTSTEVTTTTRGPSAADALAGFFEAAREMDGAIAAAAEQFNAGFDSDNVTLDTSVFPVIDALDAAALADLIPPGLSVDLETAVLAVFADLDSRVASLKGAARLIVPGNLEWILDCLENGGYSKSRFEDDFDRARTMAEAEPLPSASPDSVEAGILAVRVRAIRSMNSGCDSCGGVAYDAPIEVDWEGRSIVDGPEFEAAFEDGAWQILIYAC